MAKKDGKKLYFTRKGFDAFMKQIDGVNTEITRLQAKLGEAAEIGGNQWHDNASYETITNDVREQGLIIKRLRAPIDQNPYEILDPPKSTEYVDIGTKVHFLMNGEEFNLLIGGYGESDIDNDIVAYNTPLGDAVLGKKSGEKFKAPINKRDKEFEILHITIPT